MSPLLVEAEWKEFSEDLVKSFPKFSNPNLVEILHAVYLTGASRAYADCGKVEKVALLQSMLINILIEARKGAKQESHSE